MRKKISNECKLLAQITLENVNSSLLPFMPFIYSLDIIRELA